MLVDPVQDHSHLFLRNSPGKEGRLHILRNHMDLRHPAVDKSLKPPQQPNCRVCLSQTFCVKETVRKQILQFIKDRGPSGQQSAHIAQKWRRTQNKVGVGI